MLQKAFYLDILPVKSNKWALGRKFSSATYASCARMDVISEARGRTKSHIT